MHPNDKKNWLLRAQNGDEAAFKKIFEAHANELFRFLNQFSDRRDQVQDWVQTAFYKAFKNLDQFDGRSRFKTWLWRIGINEMKMTKRLSIQYTEFEDISSIKEPAKKIPTESIITMRNEIDKLPDQKKMVLILYEVEGYSHKEIADMLNVGESTSRTILSRTKKELRKKIGEQV